MPGKRKRALRYIKTAFAFHVRRIADYYGSRPRCGELTYLLHGRVYNVANIIKPVERNASSGHFRHVGLNFHTRTAYALFPAQQKSYYPRAAS